MARIQPTGRPRPEKETPEAAATVSGVESEDFSQAGKNSKMHFIRTIGTLRKWAVSALTYDPTTLAVWIVAAAVILGPMP